jgi:hypothetical protein
MSCVHTVPGSEHLQIFSFAISFTCYYWPWPRPRVWGVSSLSRSVAFIEEQISGSTWISVPTELTKSHYSGLQPFRSRGNYLSSRLSSSAEQVIECRCSRRASDDVNFENRSTWNFPYQILHSSHNSIIFLVDSICVLFNGSFKRCTKSSSSRN